MKKNILFLVLGLLVLSPASAIADAGDRGEGKPQGITPFPLSDPSASAVPVPVPERVVSPFPESAAAGRYHKRPKSEFSKLLYLIDRLKENDFEVLFNGRAYKTNQVRVLVTQYVLLNYRKETAEQWIQKHAYRSCKGNIIYLKDPAGNSHILKDVLLEELNSLG